MPSLRHRPRDLVQGRYEIKKLLGSGAFGTVYGCLDGELQTPVALKEMHVLDERGGGRAGALAQFRAEAIHLSKLNHPHIVRGHYQRDAGSWRICPVCGLDFPLSRECPDHGASLVELDSRHYLVMEYVGGPDLLARATQDGGRLALDEALVWMEQIASALGHVHARGFVHRDLKPENIRLRSETPEAVLLDFGIASQGDGATGDRYGTRVKGATTGGGTLGYAPPTATEASAPDARSDVFAFGMTFFHLLCGLDPTEPATQRQMLTSAPREFHSEIPVWLDELLRDCIARNPGERPQNGTELWERLQCEEESPPSVELSSGGTQVLSPAPQIEPFLWKSGHYARNVNDLVWLCDEFPDEAAKRLYDGEFERWLRAQNNETLARAAVSARAQSSKRAGLETWIQATGLVALPSVQATPFALDFGSLGREQQKSRSLKLQKTGRGWVFGTATTSAGALSTPGAFEGESAQIPFSFDAFRLPPGRYEGQIQLRGSMGELSVPWTAHVRGPSALVPFLVVLANGAWGGVVGGALRSVPFLPTGAPQPNWLEPNSIQGWLPVAPTFGAVVALACLGWATAFFAFNRSCAVLFTLLWLGLLVSAYSAFTGGSLLMGGDAFLKPQLEPIVGAFAAGGWMATGALAGALVGALWRWRDLASSRFWAVFAGVGATMGLVFLALEGARGGLG